MLKNLPAQATECSSKWGGWSIVIVGKQIIKY